MDLARKFNPKSLWHAAILNDHDVMDDSDLTRTLLGTAIAHLDDKHRGDD